MWSDNETERDFVNFSGVADTVAEIIVQAQGRPISIGISGAWGVGKSSMIKLVRKSLINRNPEEGKQAFLFVEFNAWLYQGYDDARAALMEVIANTLEQEARNQKKGMDKVLSILKRVNWFRATKLVAGSALALSYGLPPVGLIGEILQLGQKMWAGSPDSKTFETVEATADKAEEALGGLLHPKPSSSPPKEIQALRDDFEAVLDEMGITLVVLIDDLDRCLPPTTIATLEAIRLFLFLRNTAFVIAADNNMIKHAVRKHFEGVDDDLVTNYFDKLIQVPIRVPPLGTQEVRAYMMLLFIENSNLEETIKENIRAKICDQLKHTWQGKRVDRAFIQTLHEKFSDNLIGQFDTADRLAPLMTTASGILGNPRLIKRFLNALSIRMAISNSHGVGVNEAVLAKILLFERLGNPRAYAELITAVTNDEQGRPTIIQKWEEQVHIGKEVSLPDPWNDPFVEEWLKLPPRLSDQDLRGVLYVSREHAPLITPEDRLSSDAVEILGVLLEHPDMASRLKDSLVKISKVETSIIMDKLLEQAHQEQDWGAPPILDACLAVSEADLSQGGRLAAFLTSRPTKQIKPNIVPKINDQPWATEVFNSWKNKDVSPQVKKAIDNNRKK
jgi:predicted KAP-like P-loop ATPase